jgi:hypothetical protein
MKLQSLFFTGLISLSFVFIACNKKEAATNEQAVSNAPAASDATPPSAPTNTTTTPTAEATAPATEVKTEVAPVTDDSYTFDKGRMGKAKMGMSKKDFFALYPKAKNKMYPSEGIEIPAWVVSDTDGKELFWALADEGKKVTGFVTENPKMQNPEKIHFGSSYEELKKAYPKLKFSMIEGLTVTPANRDYFNMYISGVDVEMDENTSAVKATGKADKDAAVKEIWVYK